MMIGLELGESHLLFQGLFVFLHVEQPCDGARSLLGLAGGTLETAGLLYPHRSLRSCDNQTSQRFVYHGFFSRESSLSPPLIKVIHNHYRNVRKYRVTQRQGEKNPITSPFRKEFYSRSLQMLNSTIVKMKRKRRARGLCTPFLLLLGFWFFLFHFLIVQQHFTDFGSEVECKYF